MRAVVSAATVMFLLLPWHAVHAQAAPAEPRTKAEAIDLWAKNQNNHPLAEHYLREAIRFGISDERQHAWVLSRMSFNVSMQRRTEEGFALAEEAWGLLKSPEILAALIKAAVSAGKVRYAQRAGLYAEAHRDEWGDQAEYMRVVLSEIQTHEIRFSGSIPSDRFRDKKVVNIYPPMDVLGQKLLSLQIDNVESWQWKTDRLGTRYAEIVRLPGQAITFDTVVRVQPVSNVEAIEKGQPEPEGLEEFLGKTVNGRSVIDPTSDVVQGIVRPLLTGNKVTTAANILRWYVNDFRGGSPSANTTDAILAAHGGHCGHVAAAQVALLRAAGIPARMIRGWSAVAYWNKTGHPAQHWVCEYLLNGVWIRTRGLSVMPSTINTGFVCRFRASMDPDPKPGLAYCVIDGSEVTGPTGKYEPLYTYEILKSYIEDPDQPDGE